MCISWFLILADGMHNTNKPFHFNWPLKKICQETNKYLPSPLGCESKCHTCPAVRVVFPVPTTLCLLSMKQLIGAVALYIQIYRCPYLFNFAEADIFKYIQYKHTPKLSREAKLVIQHFIFFSKYLSLCNLER